MVTDRILFQDPYDIAAYSYFGTDTGKFNFVNSPEYMYEWLEDTFEDRADTVSTGFASDSTTTTCTVGTAALYQPGDIWLVGTEKIWISAISSSVITVTRGWGDSDSTTHANSSVMTRIGRARIDADDADDSPSTDISTGYNYTQILQRTIHVGRSKEKFAAYGVASWEDYLIDKNMKTLMMDLARLPYYGERYAGSASVARTAGGLGTFITDNVTYATSTAATGGTALALTRDHIDDTLTNIHADGGDPKLILTVAHAQRKINDMYEGFVSTERSEQLGGVLIKKLMNPITGGQLDVVVDRNCVSNELWILETSMIAYYPVDPFFFESLAKTGDAQKGEIVGEYGFIVANAKWHGAVKEFSTSL
jgi:hypothetical protein